MARPSPEWPGHHQPGDYIMASVPATSPPVAVSVPLRERFFAPIDIGLLVVFRVAFGACMFIEVCRYFTHGWIDGHFTRPPFHFKYYGCSWAEPLSSTGMHVVFALLGACAILMTIGLFYRVAALLFWLGFTYIFLIDQTWYLNHFYLIVLLSLIAIFLPANRAWSVDAWLRPALRSQTVPVWTLWLLRFQIAIPYVYGGIAKLNPDWLSGVPMQIMMGGSRSYPVLERYFDQDAMVYAFAYGGLLFDLLIIPALMWRWTRIPAYLTAVLFHASNARMFQIGIFPLVMVAASMLFFPPEWLQPEGAKPAEPTSAGKSGLASRQRWTLAALGLYAAFQLLVPFRHWLYPGEVSWTEEGHRFSWHMKLRSKRSQITFHARDAAGNKLEFTPPGKILVRRQLEKVGDQPDMLLQYAHFIARELEARGHRDVFVWADAQASLNSRAFQTYVDPQVNLARTPRNLWHSEWIVPLTEPLPTLEQVRQQRGAYGSPQPAEKPNETDEM
jgi:hypothetical protein